MPDTVSCTIPDTILSFNWKYRSTLGGRVL